MKYAIKKLTEATRLLADFERESNLEQKILMLKAGIDLLNRCVQDRHTLDENTLELIKKLRTSYITKLLHSLPDVRGGPTGPWLDYVAVLLSKLKPEVDEVLEHYSRNAELIQRPADGAVVEISPPGLAWPPVGGAYDYRVEIRSNSNLLVYKRRVGKAPVHLPDQVLPPGSYHWDVIALNAKGSEFARRGKLSFTIAEKAPELPWVDPGELLDRVPREHSRFLYLKRDLPSIRATLSTTRKRAWKVCLAAAERALKMPEPAYPSYHLTQDPALSLLQSRQYYEQFVRCIDKALIDLSLAFLISGEEKYAHAAKRILLEVVDWPTDDGDVTSVNARWGDEPGMILARCSHRAYDWLYEALSDEERTKVLVMCEARAWQTYRRLIRCNYLAYPGESHNGRLIAYLAEMAIVMAGESDGATTWLDYSLKAMTTIYPHWGGADGGWAEGAAYGVWYNLLYIPLFETIRMTTGFNLWKRPFFRKMRYFFFYCTALGGEISPFGDGAEKGGPGTDGRIGYASLLWYHARKFNDPHVCWWVNQIGGWNGGETELSLLFDHSVTASSPKDLPNSKVFHAVGWAALHSTLSQPDEDTFLMFKSSPYGSVSHSHADQNSFCIMKGGKALAIPSGYYGPSVGAPHHAKWTRSTKANNCVLINGEGQAVQDRRATGHISAFEDQKGLTYVSGDATAAYRGRVNRFVRHILFLRPGLFLLLDDLETSEPSRFQWMLHAFEKMELNQEEGRVVSRRMGATLDIRLRSAVDLVLAQTDQFDTPYNAGIPDAFRREMPKHWHMTAATLQRTDRLRIGAVLAVWGPHEPFELELLENPGWFGARATGLFGKVEGWVQLQSQTTGPDSFSEEVSEGKAIICGVSAQGKRFAVHESTYL